MKIRTNYLFILLSILALGFTSCSDDDDSIDPVIDPTGSLMVEDQMLENNMLSISNVTMSEPGWGVIHRDNGNGGPMVPEIISVPKMVEAGDAMDVMVELKEGEEVADGETLWAMLHTDDGAMGTYEFNGTNGLDAPIMVNGNIVTESFEVSVAPMGSLAVEDQVLRNNVVNVASITLDRGGYVVIHASNEAGDGPMVPEIISEPVYLEAGDYTNVEVPVKEEANVTTGDTVWVMLHTDTGTEEEYEFDGSNGFDLPITDAEGNVIVKPLEITDVTMIAITGSLTVDNQPVVDNQISVGAVTLSESGWVVVHASNEAGDGPMVPEIISEPMYLEAGTTEDVMVSFTESAEVNTDDTVWVMLHNDSGVAEMYEFNGMNGLDLPIVVDGNVVVTPINITE
jgi:predicted secreted protein